MLYILPDSAGDILVVQASGTLTQNDYQDIFLTQIAKQLKSGHTLRILLYFDHNLKEIEAESNWQPERFFSASQVHIARVAVVGDKQWETWANSFETPNVQHFLLTDFLTALHWTDELDV